jgi:bla regulator protein blaR1
MIPAMVRHLVESTAFAGVVALFPFLMRKRGATARHAVWFIAASKFALPLALFSAVGIELRSFLPSHRALFTDSTVVSSILLPAGPTSMGGGTTGWIAALILAVWLGGAVLMLAAWLRGFFAPAGPSTAVLGAETEALARLKQQIGLRKRVALRCMRSKVEPGISGILRLTITFPEGLRSLLAPREFEAVLLHELAHAKRRDNLTLSFVHALVCLFWFHPLLWWIERWLIAEQELACDEFVLRHGTAREEYAAGILKACRFHLTGAGACGITGSNLKTRLEAIMSFKPSHANQHVPRFLVAALASAMTVVPLVMAFLATPAAYAQNANAHKARSGTATSGREVTCTYEGKDYPMGTVIQIQLATGTVSGQRVCVEDSNGRPLWTPTDAKARQRSQHVITVPNPPPVFCRPAPSSSTKYCACQTGSGPSLFSLGAIVHSPDGKGHLRCDNGKWRPATPEELGLRGKN